MGIFGKWFKSEKDIATQEIVEIPWEILDSNEQLDELETVSGEKVVVVFKHSNTCGISRMVVRSFEKDFDLSEEEVKLYFLTIQNNRALSNEIASRFGVLHESPQLIVLKKGEVIHHASHQGISVQDLRKFVGPNATP